MTLIEQIILAVGDGLKVSFRETTGGPHGRDRFIITVETKDGTRRMEQELSYTQISVATDQDRLVAHRLWRAHKRIDGVPDQNEEREEP